MFFLLYCVLGAVHTQNLSGVITCFSAATWKIYTYTVVERSAHSLGIELPDGVRVCVSVLLGANAFRAAN